MNNLIFSLNTVAPVFIIVFIGIILKRFRQIDDQFVNCSSHIVFNISLPCLIFVELSKADLISTFDVKQILFVYLGIGLFFVLAWMVANFLTKTGKDQASFIQCSFRSNYAIVGLALLTNMFGPSVLGKAAILLAFVMPLYNVLAVIALTVILNRQKRINWIKTIMEIFKNPLIIAAIIAIIFSTFKIQITDVVVRTIDYLAALSLPLALLGIGASFNFSSIRKDLRLALVATGIKNILIPLVLTYSAYLLGYTGEDLGALFILFATPTAIVSFIMSHTMGANSVLAGNIVVISTLSSVVTISLGIYILKAIGLF